MTALDAIAWFFGGAFLANAIPHTVAGIQGRAFQSPFASPPGKGLSSSMLNITWGLTNIAAGYVLLVHVGRFRLDDCAHFAVAWAGALAIGLLLAKAFGKIHGGDVPHSRRKDAR